MTDSRTTAPRRVRLLTVAAAAGLLAVTTAGPGTAVTDQQPTASAPAHPAAATVHRTKVSWPTTPARAIIGARITSNIRITGPVKRPVRLQRRTTAKGPWTTVWSGRSAAKATASTRIQFTVTARWAQYRLWVPAVKGWTSATTGAWTVTAPAAPTPMPSPTPSPPATPDPKPPAPAPTVPGAGSILAVLDDGHASSGYDEYNAQLTCTDCSNVSGWQAWNWSHPDRYFLATASNGNLLVLTENPGPGRTSAPVTVTARVYDPVTYALLATHTTTIDTADPVNGWRLGAALVPGDGTLFLLLGRANPTESPTHATAAVRKFDENLRPLGEADIPGGFDSWGMYRAIDASAPDMALSGSTLLVSLGRLINHVPGDPAPHHQAHLTFAVNTASMKPTLIDGAWASHSFRQFVRVHGNDAVFVDHGDAYPRSVQVAVMPGYLPSGAVTSPATFDVIPIPGTVGDNATHVTVNGAEIGAGRILLTGLSAPLSHPVGGVTGFDGLGNAYVTSTDLASGATTWTWLSHVAPATVGTLVSQPRLVRLPGDRFAVLYTVRLGASSRIDYDLLDATGHILATTTWPDSGFSGVAQPTLMGERLLWLDNDTDPATGTTRVVLRGLNMADPTAPAWLSHG